MHRDIRQFQLPATMVAFCLLLLCSAPIVYAQVPPGGPGTLISEEMVAAPGSITGSGDCGNLNFNLSGVATGPYPAPFFQEQGGWSPSFPKAGTIFKASFQIKSVFGPVVGSKAAQIQFKCANPPPRCPYHGDTGYLQSRLLRDSSFSGNVLSNVRDRHRQFGICHR